MKISKYNAPGIKAVYFLEAYNVINRPDVMCMVQGYVDLFSPLNEIPLTDVADFKIEASVVNGAVQETATLKFSTPERLNVKPRIAIVAVESGGKCWLIGSRELPVRLKETGSAGLPSGEPNAFDYELAHTAIRAAVPCRSFFLD